MEHDGVLSWVISSIPLWEGSVYNALPKPLGSLRLPIPGGAAC